MWEAAGCPKTGRRRLLLNGAILARILMPNLCVWR